jgi:holo-[acyl-carrier protein] synthase
VTAGGDPERPSDALAGPPPGEVAGAGAGSGAGDDDGFVLAPVDAAGLVAAGLGLAGIGAAGLTVVGIGIDVVEVERMRTVLGRRPRFATRVFTERERAYAGRFLDQAKPLAARFAAKEAAMKAMGVGLWKFPFHDVEVTKARSGEPGYHLTGKAAELAASRGVSLIRLSMTHENSIAVAFAVALGPGAPAT